MLIDPHCHEVDRNLRAHPNEEVEHSERDQRWPEDLHATFVDEPPDHDGDDDLNVDGDDAGRLADEQSGDRHREDGENEPDQDEHEAHEQDACPPADRLGRDVGDRAALFAHARDQCAEVVCGAHEDRSKHDPSERGAPAPVRGDARPDDRRGSCDRREVVSEQYGTLRGDEIDAVFELVRWGDDVLLVLVDTLAEESCVESIRDEERAEDQSCCQRCHSSRWWAFFGFWSSTIPLSFATKNAKVPA